MKAIILAAGRSTRLYPITLDKPKGLLDLDGSNIIEYQISLLKKEGIKNIIIVTGFHADQFDYLKKKEGVKLIHNPRYTETNNLYSLWCAWKELTVDRTICLYADLMIDSGILKKALNSSQDIALVVDRRTDEETMQVKIEGEKLIDVRKAIPNVESSGTFIGMAVFSKKGTNTLKKAIENMINSKKDGYFTIAIQELIKKGVHIGYIYTDGYPWIEIDTAEDLEKLRKEVLPKLKEGKSC